MTEVPRTVTEPYVLVVEGIDEERFFGAFIKQLALTKIQIFPIGGKTKLRENLPALLLTPGFPIVTSLGIVRDADSDPNATFQSICDALQNVNLPVPSKPLEIIGNKPSTSIIILPGNNQPGQLEDLCLTSVEQDPAMTCVESYFNCLKKKNIPEQKNIAKAKVHTFLASKLEADRRLGEAAQAGYWPLDNQAFEQVKSFLQALVRR
jgi:hypothetical protein